MEKYTEAEIKKMLEEYESWVFDEEAKKLVSGFEFENFTQAMEFANGVAEIAEKAEHHPDILVHDYRFVTVFIGTHDVEGITEKDFELLKDLEENLEYEQ